MHITIIAIQLISTGTHILGPVFSSSGRSSSRISSVFGASFLTGSGFAIDHSGISKSFGSSFGSSSGSSGKEASRNSDFDIGTSVFSSNILSSAGSTAGVSIVLSNSFESILFSPV